MPRVTGSEALTRNRLNLKRYGLLDHTECRAGNRGRDGR